MGFYYQHIGRELFARDAPVSLGRPGALWPFYSGEAQQNGRFVEAGEGAQNWGLPAGAALTCKGRTKRDCLLLLETTEFRYIGQITYLWPQFREDLSDAMWEEGRFRIVFALVGCFIDFPWSDFKNSFGFDAEYHMRGNRMRLADKRIKAAGFVAPDQVNEWIVTSYGATS